MAILEGTLVWTGWSGGPGYTVLHTTKAGITTTAVDNLVSALDHLADRLHFLVPNAVTLRASTEVKEFDPATGILANIYTSPVTVSSWVGSGGTLFSAPTGACISWGTAGVNRGRRVRGKSFIVPLANGAYDTDGTLSAGFLAPLNVAATDWRTSSAYESVVWSRPRLGAGGAAFPITSHRIADKAAVLRSRRD